MTVEQKIKRSLSIILVGFFSAAVFHYFSGVYSHLGAPLNTFLFLPEDHFADYGGMKIFTEGLDPYHTLYRGQGNNYPPVGYLFLLPYTLLPLDLGRSLFAFTFLSVLIFYIFRSFKGLSLPLSPGVTVLVFSLMTYPTLFAIDRMNAELLIFVLCALFFLYSQKGQEGRGAIFLGIAGAAKVYPLAFLPTVPRQKWPRVIPITVSTVLASTALALIVFRTSPQEAWAAYGRSYQAFFDFVFSSNDGTQYGTSLYGFLKAIIGTFDRTLLTTDFNVSLGHIANVLNLLITLGSAWAFFYRRLYLWEIAFLGCVFILLAPTTGFDYKLLALYFPLLFFLKAEPSAEDPWIVAMMSLLFIPKSYFRLFEHVSSNVFLNPLLIIGIWILILRRAAKRPLTRLGAK